MLRLSLLLGWVLLASACGPIQSTAWLIDAHKSIDEARSQNAEAFAVYEWTRATLYFDKAREEAGYADYEQAVDYAKKAHAAALKAVEQSKTSPAPLPEPGGP